MMYATDKNGETIYRLTTLTVPVQLVVKDDLLFDIPVQHSEPQSDWIWSVEATTEDEEAGIKLLMTINKPVTIKRWLPLMENQCIGCGREGVKYAARHQCNACYQREQRASKQPGRSNLKGGTQLTLV